VGGSRFRSGRWSLRLINFRVVNTVEQSREELHQYGCVNELWDCNGWGHGWDHGSEEQRLCNSDCR
jgi:hypothetical protein